MASKGVILWGAVQFPISIMWKLKVFDIEISAIAMKLILFFLNLFVVVGRFKDGFKEIRPLLRGLSYL